MDRSDKIGLSAAGAGHVLLLAVLSLGLVPRPSVPPVKQDTIDVSLVDDLALTSSTRSPATPSTAQAPETGPVEDAAPAPSPAPQPVAKPEPAPPPPAPTPPPAPKVQPKPEPKPEPKPVPKPVPKPKPAPKPVADAPAKKPTPKPTPPKPKPAAPVPEARKAPAKPAQAKPSPAKSVPAKSSPAKTASAKPSTSTSTTPSKSTKPSQPAASAAKTPDSKSTASGSGKAEKPRASRLGPNFLAGVADDSPAPPTKAAAAPLGEAEKRALNTEISRQLKPKWKAPTGADVDQLVTVLRWRLNQDGSLASGPDLVEQTGKTDTNRPQQQLHIEAAMRAVRAAAPFDLPPQYYSTWKNIVAFRFDKRL